MTGDQQSQEIPVAAYLIAESRFRRFYIAAFVPLVAVVLLLGAGAAQAIPTADIVDGSVIRIENLPILDQFGHETVYNVDFNFATAISTYGVDLDYDFAPGLEEDAGLATIAVFQFLNTTSATRAGDERTLQYVVGAETQDGPVVASFVGQFYPLGRDVLGPDILPETWDACRHPQCIFGVNVFSPTEPVTYASFTVVPEPGTALLMGLGLAGLGYVGRKRREESQGTA